GFGALTLWWGLAVWFALPVDLPGLSLPALALLHIGPPVSVVAVWSLGKGALAWRARRKADRAAQAAAQEEPARREAERTAQAAALRAHRAYLECRSIFLELASAPDWLGSAAPSWHRFPRDAKTLRGAGREAALKPGLRQVFEAVFLQSAAIAWLPVYVAGHEKQQRQREWVRSAWREAAAACCEEDPPLPDCRSLPGSGPLAARVMALFDEDPDLPALVLLGMDSPLSEAPDGQAGIHPGHAVALVVLSRPGLVAREVDEADLARQLADPNLPYWEHERIRHAAEHAATGPSWGKVPWTLQADFCGLEPFAVLHRPDSVHWRDGDAPDAQVKPLQAAIETAAIHAALREPPTGDSETRKDDKASDKPETEPEPLDVGWLTHNSGGMADPLAADRLVCVLRVLNGLGCELNVAQATGNLLVEHGDVGAAASVLMLAEALIRAAQLQKPVLLAEFRDSTLDIGVTRASTAIQGVPPTTIQANESNHEYFQARRRQPFNNRYTHPENLAARDSRETAGQCG
ncbi:MAG: hypothetical protein LBP58_02775, partial [Azoarcus sp.]|nr:hypothetical protein [Azoarcus sp.]